MCTHVWGIQKAKFGLNFKKLFSRSTRIACHKVFQMITSFLFANAADMPYTDIHSKTHLDVRMGLFTLLGFSCTGPVSKQWFHLHHRLQGPIRR